MAPCVSSRCARKRATSADSCSHDATSATWMSGEIFFSLCARQKNRRTARNFQGTEKRVPSPPPKKTRSSLLVSLAMPAHVSRRIPFPCCGSPSRRVVASRTFLSKRPWRRGRRRSKVEGLVLRTQRMDEPCHPNSLLAPLCLFVCSFACRVCRWCTFAWSVVALRQCTRPPLECKRRVMKTDGAFIMCEVEERQDARVEVQSPRRRVIRVESEARQDYVRETLVGLVWFGLVWFGLVWFGLFVCLLFFWRVVFLLFVVVFLLFFVVVFCLLMLLSARVACFCDKTQENGT